MTPTQTDPTPQPEESWISRVERFNRHPLAQIAAWIFGFLGVGLAVYFFIASQASPELTYYVHPIRTAVVTAGETSSLTVTHAGRVLTGNVTAANIAIWNAGKRGVAPVLRTNGTYLSLREIRKQA
jgi:hypothetical protein